jgi:hypothetical protein
MGNCRGSGVRAGFHAIYGTWELPPLAAETLLAWEGNSLFLMGSGGVHQIISSYHLGHNSIFPLERI